MHFNSRHSVSHDFPAFHPPVYRTSTGVSYLKTAGFVLLSQPHFNPEGLRGFLDGFDKDLGFTDYLDNEKWSDVSDGEAVAKVAGQLCYMSFGPGRTRNSDVGKYLDNIKEQKHGSVFHHPTYTGLFYGMDRAVSHEVVRNATGNGFSQVSQRYVDGKVLRFVMPREFHGVMELEQDFISEIERAAYRYEEIAQKLIALQQGGNASLVGDKKRDQRKKVNQCARRYLPNCTEAPIVMTGNGRSWRFFTEQRANRHADMSIRIAAVTAYQVLKVIAPNIWSDFSDETLPDGTVEVTTPWPKI